MNKEIIKKINEIAGDSDFETKYKCLIGYLLGCGEDNQISISEIIKFIKNN